MSSTKVSSCFFHDDRLSTTRCNVCMKPLCSDCALVSEGASYCSQECSEKARRSMSHMNEITELNAYADAVEKSRNTLKTILNIVLFIFFIIIFILAWRLHWIPLDAQKKMAASVHEVLPFLDFVMKFLMGR